MVMWQKIEPLAVGWGPPDLLFPRVLRYRSVPLTQVGVGLLPPPPLPGRSAGHSHLLQGQTAFVGQGLGREGVEVGIGNK